MRRFLISLMLFSLPWALVGAGAVCYLIAASSDMTGDLGRLGMIAFQHDYHSSLAGPPDKIKRIHVDSIYSTGVNASYMLLGDSFTEASPGYVTYACIDTCAVDCVFFTIDNPFQYLIALLNNGAGIPNKVVIESVERYVIDRLCTLDFVSNKAVSYEHDDIHSRSHNILAQAAEYMYLCLGIEDAPVRKSELIIPMFTCAGAESELYIYQDDLRIPTTEHLDTAASNLKRLYEMAAHNGIELYVLIMADKYEIYKPYLKRDAMSVTSWLDDFVAAVDSPWLINSADTLRHMAQRMVKDIYYCDDTHLSPVGAKAVAEYLNSKLN